MITSLHTSPGIPPCPHHSHPGGGRGQHFTSLQHTLLVFPPITTWQQNPEAYLFSLKVASMPQESRHKQSATAKIPFVTIPGTDKYPRRMWRGSKTTEWQHRTTSDTTSPSNCDTITESWQSSNFVPSQRCSHTLSWRRRCHTPLDTQSHAPGARCTKLLRSP